MGRTGQPKARQKQHDVRRRVARTAPFERLLIVCEGSRTEPLYFDAMRRELRLPESNVMVRHSAAGTDPLTVVEYAEKLFLEGSAADDIPRRAFDRVFAVFDRDEHVSYSRASDKAKALDRKYRNVDDVKVPFVAVASDPCFELWLLLHFEDVRAPLHRDEASTRLRTHLPGYAKGAADIWQQTREHVDVAIDRARRLTQSPDPAIDGGLSTRVHELMEFLRKLKG
jgi:hypothetical protein